MGSASPASGFSDWKSSPRNSLTCGCSLDRWLLDATWIAGSNHNDMEYVFYEDSKFPMFHDSSSRCFVTSSLVAKVIALKTALEVALGERIARLDMFQTLKSMISFNNDGKLTKLKGVLLIIKFLSLCFYSISFNFVPRSAKCLAYSLEKAGLLACNSSSLSGAWSILIQSDLTKKHCTRENYMLHFIY